MCEVQGLDAPHFLDRCAILVSSELVSWLTDPTQKMWRLLVSAFLLQLVAGDSPEVTVGAGKLRGVVMETINGRQFDAFLGIPFAKPPAGQNRFKAAVPNDPWAGIWNATKKPPRCLQLNLMTYNTPFEIMGSEDCLYVNVFTPKVPGPSHTTDPLDVLVYIHGGAFHFLSGATYGPEYIMDRDVVYVSFNYRLGPMGFLGFDDDVLPGNNGLKDQLLAMKWVKQNIAAFGGDPNRITVAGMSAGAASVHYHILSKQSRGLFHKAILNSGVASNPWARARNIREESLKLVAELGCPTDDTAEALECLRQRPAEHIVEAMKILKVYTYWPNSPICPVIEKPGPSACIDKQPFDIIKSGEAADIPILWTYANDEGQFPGGQMVADKSGRLDKEWDYLMPYVLELNSTVGPSSRNRIVQKVRQHYLGDKKIRENPGGFFKMLGERWFHNGIHDTAKLHAEYSESPNWVYRLSYVPSVRIVDAYHIDDIYKGGACHGDDTHLVLRASYAPLEGSAEDRKMINYMVGVWMNFIQGNMPSDWATVKSGLPDLTFLDIVSSEPEKNDVKTEKSSPGQELWRSFLLPENSAELIESSHANLNYL